MKLITELFNNVNVTMESVKDGHSVCLRMLARSNANDTLENNSVWQTDHHGSNTKLSEQSPKQSQAVMPPNPIQDSPNLLRHRKTQEARRNLSHQVV